MKTMELLTTIGGVALALASGASGAVLIEMLWRPRRDRRKAATLLLAEILLNTEVLLLQSHARLKNPRNIPGDFHMSTLAWDTVGGALVELPPETLKSALLLYNRYADLNANVGRFAEALRDIQALPVGSDQRKKAERNADVIIDVFNTSIDSSIDHAKKLTPTLFALARVKPGGEVDTAQLKAKVDQLFAQREERIRRVNEGK